MLRNEKTTVAIVFTALLCAALAWTGFAGERTVVEGILVRVNDRVISISDFEERLRQELSQLTVQPEGDEIRQFAQQLFASMVDEMVLLERARERRLEIDDNDLDLAIEQLRKENNLVEDQAFQQALASAGLTEEGLRERYRQSMVLQRVVQDEVSMTEVTIEELRKSYEASKESFRVPEKVELEQLFFEVAEDGSNREQVLNIVRGLVSRVRSGSDLAAEATLAGVELQELGSIPIMDLRDELRSAVEPLPEGGLTDAIVTSGGYQVIRMVRRTPAGYQPFEEVKDYLRRRAAGERREEQSRALVDRYRAEYLVETHPELMPLLAGRSGDG